jgi:RimJ/RimL family protein N-acetyltransferase
VYLDLPDGSRIRVRPIRPRDKALLADGLQRLSEETIRRRFLAAKPRFSAAELRYLTEVDGVNHIALVAVDPDDPRRLIGVARSVRLADSADTAEMAIVVGDPWQGRGIGSVLAEALADTAHAAGIRKIAAVMLADNDPARRLMTRIARHLDREGHPSVEGSQIRDGVREFTVEFAA